MKIKNIFGLVALSIFTVGCSKDVNTSDITGVSGKKIPFSAVISASNSETRGLSESEDGSAIITKWEKDEQVALIHNDVIDVMTVTAVDENTNAATIKGSITGSPQNGDAVTIIYPASAVDSETKAVRTDLLKEQDGKLSTISEKFDYRTAESTLSVTDGGSTFGTDVKLSLQYAIWKLSLTDGNASLSASKFLINDSDGNALITVTPTSISDNLFIAMPPASDASFSFKAVVGENSYVYAKSGVSFKSGKYYNSTMNMTQYVVSLNKTSLDLSLGNSETLTATITPEDAEDKTLIWSSSDEKVVTVDENGKVTAVDAGTATIKVTNKDESVVATCDVKVAVDLSTPLTFEAKVAGVTVKFNSGETAANVEYSVNAGDWTALTSAGVTLTAAGDKVAFRGTNESYCVSLPSYTKYQFSLSDNCFVYGNIMSLINKETFASLTELTATDAFNGLFAKQSNLLSKDDDHRLLLPATKLSNSCYNEMFYQCTGLTKAPELPAKNMTYSCYQSMFQGCTSLEKAPELPATALDKYCYNGMFQGCSNLTKAPTELPATELKYLCYTRMFKGCAKLTTAPQMKINSVAEQSCEEMFQECTALTTASNIELKATTLQQSCYKNMFQSCKSLTTGLTELPATKLADFCYESMFSDCSKLTEAPSIKATTLAMSCCAWMFTNCKALTTAPELKATELKSECYQNMFQGCTSLTTAPTELPATTLAYICYEGMFSYCSNLTTAPIIKATTLASGCCKLMFYNCTSLTSAPDLKATTLTDECYLNIFMGCSKLSSIVCLATSGFDTTLSLGNWLENAGTEAVTRTLHVKEGKAGEAWSVPTGTYSWTITDDK